uniref:Uncharacterized protein n=1 Tax=Moniliophthora roreri TaxID=221103 RepID=A0A0W0GBB2_MONRR
MVEDEESKQTRQRTGR